MFVLTGEDGLIFVICAQQSKTKRSQAEIKRAMRVHDVHIGYVVDFGQNIDDADSFFLFVRMYNLGKGGKGKNVGRKHFS